MNSIIERVRRLMAMAEDASSPNEAAIAARRARMLMDKHQLDHDDIESAQQDFADGIAGNSRKFIAKWEQSLAVKIAQLNDCQVRRTNEGQLRFEGLTNDVEVCKYMFHYLTRAAKRQCSTYLKDLGYSRYNARLGNAWKQGFSSEVRAKMTELIKERDSLKTSSGKDLVVMKLALVHQHFGTAVYQKSRSTWHNDSEAAEARDSGRAAGQRASIHTGIGSGSNGDVKRIS